MLARCRTTTTTTIINSIIYPERVRMTCGKRRMTRVCPRCDRWSVQMPARKPSHTLAHTHYCHGSDNAMHRAQNIEWLQRTRIIAHMLLSVAISFPLIIFDSCIASASQTFIAISPACCALPLMLWLCISAGEFRLSIVCGHSPNWIEHFSQVRRFKRNRREKSFSGPNKNWKIRYYIS